jgi:heat shock protein HslJ
MAINEMESRMKQLFPILLAGVFSATAAMADGVMSLAGSEWGLGPDATNGVMIKFEPEGKVWGRLGCNRFTGTYKQDGVALAFGPLATTRMACVEEKMKTEQMLSEALIATQQAAVTHLKLVLQDASGKELVTLQRRDFD